MKNPFSLNFLFKNKSEDKDEEVFFPVCPKCISPNLEILKEFTSGWLTTPKYVCRDCNYNGQVILEIDIKMLEDHSPEEIKKLYYQELSKEDPEEF